METLIVDIIVAANSQSIFLLSGLVFETFFIQRSSLPIVLLFKTNSTNLFNHCFKKKMHKPKCLVIE